MKKKYDIDNIIKYLKKHYPSDANIHEICNQLKEYKSDLENYAIFAHSHASMFKNAEMTQGETIDYDDGETEAQMTDSVCESPLECMNRDCEIAEDDDGETEDD